jgi:serine protease Do
MITRYRTLALAAAVLTLSPAAVRAADPYDKVFRDVNTKMVKIFGAGGFQRLNSFGTGIVISPEGHVLTVANPLIDNRGQTIVVHLYDGRRMKAVVLAVERELDAAIIKVVRDEKEPLKPLNLELAYFDVLEAAKRPPAEPGDSVLGFSNQFEIALRDEPLSVQRGVIAAYTDLDARKGGFDFPYRGKVYVVDAITNNPGAAGGALTDRQGNLLGVIGRELQNNQTDTWINYAIPVHAAVPGATVTVTVNGKEEQHPLTMPLFVRLGMEAKYKAVPRKESAAPQKVYTGITFVPNVLAKTPAYVESVEPDSPAARAGLMPDDLIAFVDGRPVASINDFNNYLETRTKPGTKIQLEVRRKGGLMTVELTVEAPPVRPPIKK